MKNILLIVLLAIVSTLTAQIERPKWELGGGIMMNYMSLNGGFSAHRNSDGFESDIQYDEIGMNTYSTSFGLAVAGRYKQWNLELAGSRGSYEGGFTAETNIVRDDVEIDSGAVVDGTVDMQFYLISTAFNFYHKKHDLGAGIGLALLYMGANYVTTDVQGEEVKLGDSYWFPMPFLAISGRLNFDRFKLAATVGGAIFKGNMEGADYDVEYFILDLSGAYEFLKKNNWTYIVSAGYRNMFLYLDVEKDVGWYNEEDIYQGPYMGLRVKFSSQDLWKF